MARHGKKIHWPTTWAGPISPDKVPIIPAPHGTRGRAVVMGGLSPLLPCKPLCMASAAQSALWMQFYMHARWCRHALIHGMELEQAGEQVGAVETLEDDGGDELDPR